MELSNFVTAFEALAHDTRLAVFRLLIPAGPAGLAAGTIGARLGLAPNSLSFHLGRLVNAGLVRGRRQGRHIFYAVDYAELGELVGFFAGECCADVPEGCLPGCPGTDWLPHPGAGLARPRITKPKNGR